MKKKIIIIGGGFGGLNAAKELKDVDAEILLIDKANHHLFQPLLYQVATAALSPADIASPIRAILNKQKNITVLMGEVISIDTNSKKILTEDSEYKYDYLILAPGSRHSYFGNDAWEEFAPGLKTINDAINIRQRILTSFEQAEKLHLKDEQEKYLTFVIVGGGPTGVEMAGAISEIASKILLKDFRNIDSSMTKIILVESLDRILTMYDPSLSEAARRNLEKMGVNTLLNTRVTNIDEKGVYIDGVLTETPNVIWAAGNSIPKITKTLKVETDRSGRIPVENDCSIKEHPEVFVIGDAASYIHEGKPLPGVAPVAIQQGKFVGKTITNELNGKKREEFHYFDKGNLATIGRAKAVMQIGKIKISGIIAWIAWIFVHIMYLIGFRNRYKVMSEWIWYYFTYRHGMRLITFLKK
ncbi:MAG: NAD(P)/FAD-dependent oxidoreductase [Melioribacteraceae bacterium]|nr:NAD(P)/FAD-dependent oxidoreductase [Melioribacteraceae bacterium]